MLTIHAVTLEGYGIRLEPLSYEHGQGLALATADGKLWELWFTLVPEQALSQSLQTIPYIETFEHEKYH